MSQNNKVIWSEGLFLRPQHFQQQDRHVDALVRHSVGAVFPYGYGFLDLRVDEELLKLGKVGIVQARGITPDGTLFNIPADSAPPAPLDIPSDAKNAIVCLTIPLRRAGMPDSAFEASRDAELVRYVASEIEARDAMFGSDNTSPVLVGEPNLRIQLADNVSGAFASLGLARVVEKRPDGQVVLDANYIPPSLDCRANPRLDDWLKSVFGLLRHRGQALADRVAQPSTKGVAEIADFLLLQVCNRCQPLFEHLQARPLLHPEHLYQMLLGLAGELSTFGRKERRVPDFAPYRHDALETCFPPVMDEIRRALTAVLDQTAVGISLVDKGKGVFFGDIKDASLIRAAAFVLAVGADLPAERLRASFPTQVKIGPVDKIRDLVMSHLPGIVVRPLPVAPRQIPYHAGLCYFELDRGNDLWKSIETTRVIAMHLAGEFPGLALEMWAIRD